MGKVVHFVSGVMLLLAIVQIHQTDSLNQKSAVNAKPMVDRVTLSANKPRKITRPYVKPAGKIGRTILTVPTPHDIFFVVDTSASIGSSNFNTIKKFMKTLVKSMIIGPQRHHAGVVTFATWAQIRVNYIMSTKSHCHFLKEIDRLPYDRGMMTNTKGGFSWLKNLIQQSFINRPNSKKIVFYLTDGDWNYGGNPNNEIKQVKNLGEGGQVVIFAIGIGNNVSESHLKYASTYGYWQRIPTFELLIKMVGSVGSRMKGIAKVVNYQYDGVSKTDCGYCLGSRCSCNRCACEVSTGNFVCRDHI